MPGIAAASAAMGLFFWAALRWGARTPGERWFCGLMSAVVTVLCFLILLAS